MEGTIFTSIPVEQLIKMLVRELESMRSSHPFTDKTTKWLVHEQAAEHLHISKAALYKLTSSLKIPYSKRGKRNYYNREDLDAYLAGGINKCLTQIVEESLPLKKNQ